MGFLLPVTAAYWVKTRTSYTTNSWIYTTNHKRIAVNYFIFVLVSGTAGMSLASAIRLEFAYPGVGILAGDSLQYLSIATAHGVIMVFFMIMPAVFGAFGNFLLPTQLGVHDVAFPRLNSAAFWFLPGGLIMLMQLVCVDRRYQRMNCFNVRELQGNLKRKFFTDLVNSNDHRDFLNQSILGMRFKTNNNLAITPDMEAFYNFGTTTTSKAKTFEFVNVYAGVNTYLSTTVSNLFNPLSFLNLASLNVLTSTVGYIKSIVDVLISINVYSLFTTLNIPNALTHMVSFNLNHFKFTFNLTASTTPIVEKGASVTETTFFNSENMTTVDSLTSYDYKCGHYLGIWAQLYPSLMTSYIE